MGRHTVNIDDDLEERVREHTTLEDSWSAIVNEAIRLWADDRDESSQSS